MKRSKYYRIFLPILLLILGNEIAYSQAEDTDSIVTISKTVETMPVGAQIVPVSNMIHANGFEIINRGFDGKYMDFGLGWVTYVSDTPGASNIFNNGFQLEIGDSFRYKFTPKIFIQPGVSYFMTSTSFSKQFVNIIKDISGENLTSVSAFREGIRIHVCIGDYLCQTPKFRWSVTSGVGLSYAYSGKIIYRVMGDNQSYDGGSLLSGKDAFMQPFNLTLIFGSMLEFKRCSVGIKISALGTDLSKNSQLDFREAIASFQFAYRY